MAYDKRPEMQRYEELHLVFLQVVEMASKVLEKSTYVKEHANERVTHLNSWKKEKQKEMGNCDFMKGSTSKWGRKHGGNVTSGIGVKSDEGRIENNLPILNPM
ncbi:hypothetical protein SLE2022_292180 [Rubroshorea leprosula]